MTACSVMPIYCILLIKFNSCCKVSDRLVVLEESVPNETSSVIRRGILWIKLNDSVKVLKGEL